MPTFMLIMHLANAGTSTHDTYILALSLSASECIAAQNDYYNAAFNPAMHITCERERTK